MSYKNYEDCLFAAVSKAMDAEVPPELWSCTISNQAALFAGLESGQVAGVWD